MIRLTRQTDYGIVLLTRFAAAGPGTTLTARELHGDSRLPLPMVSKILKTLVRGGLLVSHRGVKGGYALARPPEQVTMATILQALEGPFGMTECSQGPDATCEHQTFCAVRSNWQLISEAVVQALEGLTLADMARPLQEGPGRGLVHIEASPGRRFAQPLPGSLPEPVETA